MKKHFLIFAIFVSLLYIFQDANALDYVCDSRLNYDPSLCSECTTNCYLRTTTLSCSNVVCPDGKLLVDCYDTPSYGGAYPYTYACIDLQCGDAGVTSGNTCVQNSAYDNGCVDTAYKTYGWTDNTGFLTCACSYYESASILQYYVRPDGRSCTGKTGTCLNGACIPPLTPPACSDGTPEGSCCGPGTKCLKDTITGLYRCATDSSCPTCLDDDVTPAYPDGKNPTKVSTCKDTSKGMCDAFQSGGSKCTDTCASTGSVTEYYCAGSNPSALTCMPNLMSCGSSSFCSNGKCDSGSGGGTGGGGVNPGSSECSWWYNGGMGSTCSSGCPASYPNQQQVCCDTNQDKGCNGGPACASYNPTVGETPCCYATGYKTCTAQETCTPTGCQNVCTTGDKTSELYCSKCNSCQDGIQNCGEPSVDKCGEPCTVSQTTEYVKWSPYYCSQVCAGDGATCVAVMGSSGQYYPQGCSQGWTGNCKCSKTENVFNPASCSDGVQNCAETCVDGSAQCSAGKKETDNTYLVSFEFSQPAELSGTSLYSDANSWNCMDGLDNDHDCLVDCADTKTITYKTSL